MSERERHRDDASWSGDSVPAAGSGGSEALRDAADHFLRQADRALDRALSGDSEAFLRANRQQGGQ